MIFSRRLSSVLETALAAFPGGDLRSASEKISARYREPEGDKRVRDEGEAIAYAAVRMPATYAAVSRALEIARSVAPQFAPATLLDLGAGPGTAALAAAEAWSHHAPPSLRLIERNPFLMALGEKIFSGMGFAAEWEEGDIAAIPEFPAHEMIVASYALNELEDHSQARLIEKAWDATTGMLLLVEPGTPAGSDIIIKARNILIDKGARILAPCPHEKPCPLRGDSDRWCHFSVRLPRSREHKRLKGGRLGYEDEKFSFLAAARFDPTPRPAYRIIGHPRGAKVAQAEVCGRNGAIATLQEGKSSPLFKLVKQASWGDAINMEN